MKFSPSSRADRENLYLGNLNTVAHDLVLPTTGPSGAEISWKSDQPRYLADNGKVTRPKFGMGDRDVQLTAVFRDEKETVEKTYTVHILEDENRIQVREIPEILLNGTIGVPVDPPSAVPVITQDGDMVIQPVAWKVKRFGSDQPGLYEINGLIRGTLISVTAKVAISANASAEPVVPRKKREAFARNEVRLDPDTLFYDQQERMHQFLLTVDDDRMLYNFRKASGLSTKEALPLQGWDSPSCQLRGHTTGHYLSALALCYEATGDSLIREKALYLVSELQACQDAFASLPGCHPGFLSGYGEEQFDQLEQLVRYPTIWAPYYTLHKIMAGLLDAWRAFSSDAAFTIVRRMGVWVYHRLSRLTKEQRNQMWSLYIAGEYGGMNEVMARLYQYTGDSKFLHAAHWFDNDGLFFPLEEGLDALSGMHANQHVPQVIGALAMYEASGEKKYHTIARNFQRFVTDAHMYAIGGVGEGEMFHRAGRIASLLTRQTAESCVSYNMLKLTRELYQIDPDERLMDAYERTVTNHTLAASQKAVFGRTTYFMPLSVRAKKSFEDENSCCHGTGMESPFCFGDAIWFSDEQAIYIEQWIPSHTKTAKLSVALLDDSIQILVKYLQAEKRDLVIRRPAWTEGQDSAFIFRGPFSAGEERSVSLPCRLQFEPAPDDPDLGVLTWGPYVLAAVTEQEERLCVKKLPEKVPGKLEWEGEGIRYLPFAEIEDEMYQVYLRFGR